MKFSSTLILCTLSLTLAGACGDDTPPYQRLVDAQTDFGETLCTCAEALGVTEETCFASFVPPAPSQMELDCVADVIADNEAEFNEAVDCIVDLYARTTACFADVNACDEAAFDACFGSFADEITECPEVSESVSEEIGACAE
jgi:hypothetical protein